MIIDTHSHLNFNAFKEDSDEVIKKTLLENIWMINVGTKYETSKSAVEMAEKYDKGVFAAIGLHPMYAAAEFIKLKTDPDEGEFLIREQEFNTEKYKELVRSQKVVAIGEIGLDYYYKPKTKEKLQQFKEKQKQIFLQQLDLAKELNLPLILHCRMAHDDIEMGFYIGLNGIIFKFNIDETIKQIPLDRILIETDCPYLTPPQESGKRNEPIFIKHTIQKIADLKNISFDEVCNQTTENAKKLFNLT